MLFLLNLWLPYHQLNQLLLPNIWVYSYYNITLGYYLVNLAERKYYYCGETWEDVKAKFLDLGIGR